LDVELVENLDLGAREEELHIDNGGVPPEWGWCTAIMGMVSARWRISGWRW
jgi:hypothetical protein